MPRVSVIIPTYNRANLLAHAIQSVLEQTMSDLQLIVVDDGSTDNTPDVIAHFKDPRLCYVRQTNQGRSAARNHGARLARSDFLGFLDSDDMYLPESLEAHLKKFRQQPKLGMTIGGYQYVNEKGQPTGERLPWTEGGSLDLYGWLFNCYATPCSVLLRTSWFERVGGFYVNLDMAEDWEFFLRLAHAGCPMRWLQQPVYQYREHTGSSVHAITKHRDGALQALERLFGQSSLPAEITDLERKAKAWVYVVFAKKAYAIGQILPAIQDLRHAIQLDPELAGPQRISLLEFLISDGWVTVDRKILFSNRTGWLPKELNIKPGDFRRAQARVEMAQFFQAYANRDKKKAVKHLKSGLRLDPTWLVNRGVISFCLKRGVIRNA